MKHSEIRETHAQHGTFLIGARFAGLPGLHASHFIQAFNTGNFVNPERSEGSPNAGTAPHSGDPSLHSG